MDESDLEIKLSVPLTTFDSTPGTSGIPSAADVQNLYGSVAGANELAAARTDSAWAALDAGVSQPHARLTGPTIRWSTTTSSAYAGWRSDGDAWASA